ncbi:MAG: hypothetical protein F6K41_17365 [Symploca sp. SIO3E6]|nr:hypothetical protein [Caldora sp. SIO3E6]
MVIGYLLFVVCCLLFVISHWLFVVCYLLSLIFSASPRPRVPASLNPTS